MVALSADESVSDSEESTETSATQVVTQDPVVEESNAEAITEASTVLTEFPMDTTEPTQPAEDTQPSIEASQSTKPEVPEPIIYDAHQVVNLVIAKC